MDSRIRCARASTTWVVDVGAAVRAVVVATAATGRAAVAVRVVAAVVVTAVAAATGPVVAGRSVVKRCCG
jgi:hypothetical protein